MKKTIYFKQKNKFNLDKYLWEVCVLILESEQTAQLKCLGFSRRPLPPFRICPASRGTAGKSISGFIVALFVVGKKPAVQHFLPPPTVSFLTPTSRWRC